MPSSLWAVLAPSEYMDESLREFAFKKIEPILQIENLFLFAGKPVPVEWAEVSWLNVQRLPIVSISEAVKKLRTLAKKWDYLPLLHRGRSALIHEQLRGFKRMPLGFPAEAKLAEGIAAFALASPNELLWCRDFDRPDPLGQFSFVENKDSAPSRAYLKLWEAFAHLGRWPKTGERAVDLGACPGGWTWVLASLEAQVLALDRSPLDPRVAAMPGVLFRKGDAFQALPDSVGAIDWLCSDVICVPEKLLELVKVWITSGKAKHFVCTLKFQGDANPETVAEFAKLGKVVHLYHNKHELTFLR